MIGDEIIQQAIITKLKSLAPFSSSFGQVAMDEVREFDWQGTTFTYPNVRVDLENNRFYYDEQRMCTLQVAEFSVYIYSEQKSSKECSQIKTSVINSFSGGFTSNGIRILDPRILENMPALREDSRTWRSQVRFGVKVHPAT